MRTDVAAGEKPKRREERPEKEVRESGGENALSYVEKRVPAKRLTARL